MKAKDRITVIACVNATGSCKLPPVMIGSAKKHVVLPHAYHIIIRRMLEQYCNL